MKNYIIIWSINDYPWMWWWTTYDFFEKKEELEPNINEILKDKKASIDFCWKIENEIKFKAVTTVTKWELE